MSVRRLWPVLLLVPLGVVTGHQAVYAALHTHTSGAAAAHSHGHIGVLASLGLPLGLAGAGWLARRTQRDLVLPALALLAGAQVVAFAAMETLERMAVGSDVASLVRSPLLWTGVAFQVAVALAIGLQCRGHRLGRHRTPPEGHDGNDTGTTGSRRTSAQQRVATPAPRRHRLDPPARPSPPPRLLT